MKKVCAWCKIELEAINFEGNSGEIISHGICAECKENILGPQQVEFTTFLDSLSVPIIVVNAIGNAETANTAARVVLEKELPEIIGFQGGVVFDCTYSTLPEGCGKTIHCSGCMIRNTVMDTFISGTSHLEIMAPLTRDAHDETQEINLLISTEKFKDIVLLRIDNIGTI